jgi:hypothetical protein
MAGLIGVVSLVEGGADSNIYIKGDLNCESPIDSSDVLLHLQAQAGLRGVSAYCDQIAWGGPGCDPGPAPSTNCDYPVYLGQPAPTSVPGGQLPRAVMDIDCDEEIAVRDALLILLYVAGLPAEVPCDAISTYTYVPVN